MSRDRFVQQLKQLFRLLFGEVRYQSPEWARRLGRWIGASVLGQKWNQGSAWSKKNPRRAAGYGAGALVTVLALGYGVYRGILYYDSLPQPDYVEMKIMIPREPDLETGEPDRLLVRFSKSVAALEQLNKPLDQGITLKPEIKGTWRWISDRELEFKPVGKSEKNGEWQVGQRYDLSFAKKFFASHVLLKDYSDDFTTPKLRGQISSREFYQDPLNPLTKKVIVTVTYNYALDTEDLKKRVRMGLQSKDESALGKTSSSFPVAVSFSKFLNEVSLVSDPIPMPDVDMVMMAEIDKGVRASRGGLPAQDVLRAEVPVPGKLTYFRFQSPEIIFARNDRYEPEQVLILNSKAEASSEVVGKSLEVFLLPRNTAEDKNKKRPHRWRSASEVTEAVRAQMEKVPFTVVPTEHESSTQHSFKLKPPVGRWLYIRIPKGLKSYGGYELAQDFEEVVLVPNYPKELLIMSQGSLLSLSGDKKIPMLGRNLHKVKFQISKILPAQLNQLMVQVYGWGGDFAHPNFDAFSEDTLVEKFEEKRTLAIESEAATQYFSLDLGPYLSKGSGSNRGLFYLKVSEENGSVEDRRLVLLTDLGVIVKETVAKTHDVFVQNVRTGGAVAGATVQVMGANGIPIMDVKTNADGVASFPDLRDFKNEKRPVAFLVLKDGDFSYLPYQMSSRQLSFSKFDVGGIYDSNESDQLTSYLFSDRGLYRPGDTINVGLMVRAKSWKKTFKGVPVTWSISDPRGTEVHREKIQASSGDLLSLHYTTQDSSATGTYEIRVFITKKNEVDQQIGSLNVRIEEFLPDRMRITTHLSQERLDGWVHPQNLNGTVRLQNLFGTAAENRVVTGSMTLTPVQPTFKSLRDYTFTEFKRDEKTFSEQLAEKKSDSKGEATFDFDLSRFGAGLYSLRFDAEGFEAAGGRGVSASSAVLVSSLPYLIGVKKDSELGYLNKDSAHEMEVIAVDPELKKIAISDVQLTLVERKYVSTLIKQYNGTYKYQSAPKEIAGETKTINIAKEGSRLAIPTGKPGDYTYVFKDKRGVELNKIQFSVAGEGNLSRSLDKNAELQVTLNKKDFAPGEEIEMQIKAPYTGSGLITIERDRVFASHWFKTSTTATVAKIKIPAGVEGTAYVNVTFLRALDSKEIFMSPLSYAVQPFSVSLDEHKTKLTLTSPERVRPGQKLKIGYSANRRTKIILYGVDEGILLVAKYKMPDPLTYFFQRRALQVKTYQILDLLLPEFSVVQALSAPGGDASGALGKNLNPFKRKTDKPVVFWSGVLDAGPEKKEFTYEIPEQFNGSMKIMAVAATETAFGAEQRDTLVRGDFILTPNIPVFVAPLDEFDVGVGVSNQAEGSGPNAKVNVEIKADDALEVAGSKSQEIEIAEGRESSTQFHLKTRSRLGSAKIQVQAKWQQKSAKASMELSVRPAVPYMADLLGGLMDGTTETVAVPRALLPEFREQQAALSPVPMVLTKAMKAFLESFPYGCTEQLTSKAFAFIILKSRPEVGLDPKKANEAYQETLQILRTRQTSAGGFAMYSPIEGDNLMATLYVVHFLIEARDRGFAVPQEIFLRAFEFIQGESYRKATNLVEGRLFAYSLYLQARAGKVPGNDVSFLRKLLEKNVPRAWETDLAAGYLASTYKLLKQDEGARILFRKLELAVPVVPQYEYFYDGLARDMALIGLAGRHFPDRLKNLIADQPLRKALKPLAQGQYNTFAAANAILAIDALVTNASKSEALSQMKIEEIAANGSSAPLNLPNSAMPIVSFSENATKLKYTRGDSVPLFYFMWQSGFDRELPKTEIKKDLEITRDYLDGKGNVVKSVPIGEEVVVRLRVRSLRKTGIPNVAIVDLLPGGFEPVLEIASHSQSEPERRVDSESDDLGLPIELDGSEGSGEVEEGASHPYLQLLFPKAWAQATSTPQLSPLNVSYVDRREDRLVIYVGFIADQVYEYTYKMKAVNQGSYVVPPPFGESMYDRSVQFRGLSSRVTVEARK